MLLTLCFYSSHTSIYKMFSKTNLIDIKWYFRIVLILIIKTNIFSLFASMEFFMVFIKFERGIYQVELFIFGLSVLLQFTFLYTVGLLQLFPVDTFATVYTDCFYFHCDVFLIILNCRKPYRVGLIWGFVFYSIGLHVYFYGYSAW